MALFGAIWLYVTLTVQLSNHLLEDLRNILYSEFKKIDCSSIISNQKMNAYLKGIAGVCEIEKDLTFHIARHTFATTVKPTNGIPIESVSKMLGHKNLKTPPTLAKFWIEK